MKLSGAGVLLIKRFESLRLVSYQDAGSTYTIGWGATTYPDGSKVQANEKITAQYADILLLHHIGVAMRAVDRLVEVPLTQSQYDALVSFTYNVGGGNFARSSLLRAVNQAPNNMPAINSAFLVWVTAKGKFYQGLENRRKAEISLYANGANGTNSVLTFIGILIFLIIISYYILSK